MFFASGLLAKERFIKLLQERLGENSGWISTQIVEEEIYADVLIYDEIYCDLLTLTGKKKIMCLRTPVHKTLIFGNTRQILDKYQGEFKEEKVQKKHIGWLTTVPSGDVNFRDHLKEANIATLQEALKDKTISKTARRMIGAQIKRLEKKQ